MKELFIVTHYSCVNTHQDHYLCTCKTEVTAQQHAEDLLYHMARLFPYDTSVYRVPGGRLFALRKKGCAEYLHVAVTNRETIVFE